MVPWGALPALLLVLSTSGAQAKFSGLYTSHIEEAHETIPNKVGPNGEHLSHNLTTFHDELNSDHVHFNVSIGDENHVLVVQPSKHFLAPAIIVERRKRDVHTRYIPSGRTKHCHYQGVVEGQPQSRVAVSACNGLAGLIHTKSGKYYIEPASHESKTVGPGHKHLIYKRSAVGNYVGVSKKKKKRKKKKAPPNCGTKEPKRLTELKWQKQHDGRVKIQEKKHKHKHKLQIPSVEDSQRDKYRYKNIDRPKRSISKPHYVETLLVADSSMVEFHQDGDIETYILTIMNMVSSLYLDPTIGNYVHVVVVKIILLEDTAVDSGFIVKTNADITLRNFCKWQKNLNPGNDSNPHHHDVAILITRKDICARQDQPCNTLGVAHIGGMCKASRSCSVNEDNGITSAHTIAHEMGHNFNMLHDTEKSGCTRKEGNKLFIMTPSFQADIVTVNWSNCSRREITNFLDKGLGRCLHDEPQLPEKYTYPELPPGAMYNADHQCRLQFGPGAVVCVEQMFEICSRLWCEHDGTCTTRLKPAAPGTNCGKHKWCQDQKCVPIMEPPVAIDGGWGEWGEWSECSRTCGSGVSVTTRECDHPTPAAGGRFCVGERRRYRICNTDPCPKDEPSFREVQCASYNNQSYNGVTYEWHAYFNQGEPCKLYCSDANASLIVPWGDYAADGTPCSVVSRDVCISGICKSVGCDWVVDSSAKEDDCGICQGDGTKCVTKSGVYPKQSHMPGYREIVVVPKNARNVRIEEKGYSENYIAIGSTSSKKFYLNGKRHITLPGEYLVAGTQALYERENQMEKIKIPGPILEPIVIYIFFAGQTYNPGVEYKYSLWKPETTKQLKYSWILGDWTQCSATCGGGVQRKQPLCQESTVSLVSSELDRPSYVDEYMCEPDDRPDQPVRTCNDDPCPSHWWVGPWQTCPVSCLEEGGRAMRHRSVMCVDGNEMAMTDQYCDTEAKPAEYEPCRALPTCPEAG